MTDSAVAACPACDSFRGARGRDGFLRCPACGIDFAERMAPMDAEGYRNDPMYLVRDHLQPAQEYLSWHHREFLRRGLLRGGRLLDVGCGNGNFLRHASRAGYRVSGLDIDPDAVRAARYRFGLEDVHCADLAAFLSARLRPFDVVTIFGVLEHLADPGVTLALLARVVRPGGRLVVLVPDRDRWPRYDLAGDRPPHHLTRYDAPALRGLLERRGFRVTRIVRGWTIHHLVLLDWIDRHLLAPYGVAMVSPMVRRAIADPPRREALLRRALRLLNWKYFLVKALAWPPAILLRGMGSRGLALYAEAERCAS